MLVHDFVHFERFAMRPKLLLCTLSLLCSFVVSAQEHGAIVFYSDVPNTTFYNNNIIEVSDHEIIFDLNIDHSISSIWTRIMVDFMGHIDTFRNAFGGKYLMKANFKTKKIEAIHLSYFNYYTRTNIYLLKRDSTFYYIDPEVDQDDSMMFAGKSRSFTIAKGPKTVLAEFDFDLNLKLFSDYAPSSETIISNNRVAKANSDGYVFTQNEKGTRKRYELIHAIPMVSTVYGRPSYLTSLTVADRWGSYEDGHAYNQSGTFDNGLFLSANAESLTNQYRVYTVNYLYDNLKVDTLGTFESNAVFTSICDGSDSSFKWVSGLFSNALFYNKALIADGLGSSRPIPFVAKMNKSGGLSDFQVFDSLFASITISSVEGNLVLHGVSVGAINEYLEHYLMKSDGSLEQMKNEFSSTSMKHRFSQGMSSGAIVSSTHLANDVNAGGRVHVNKQGMLVISLTEPFNLPKPQASVLDASLVSCNEAALKWTSTGDEFYTILVSLDSVPDYLPLDGMNYNFSPVYAMANRVSSRTRILYQGTDTTLHVSALVSGSKYFFHVVGGNGPAGSTVYNNAAISTASLRMPVSSYKDSLSIYPARDTAFCSIDTVVFTAAGSNNYVWSNGLKRNVIRIASKEELHFLSTMPDNCVVSSDTVLTRPILQPYLTDLFARADAPYCPGDTVPITGRSNLSGGYVWSTGDTLPTIYVTASGTYQLQSINAFCKDEKSIQINFSQFPTFDFAEDTLSLQYDAKHTIALNTDADKWEWTYFNTQGHGAPVSIVATTSGYLIAQGFQDSPCVSKDSVYLKIYKPDSLLIPNAFTPDGDGLNDVWSISSFYGAEYTVEVYDRWGALLHLSNADEKGWNGKKNGALLPTGAYYYIVKQKGAEAVKSGCLYLLD